MTTIVRSSGSALRLVAALTVALAALCAQAMAETEAERLARLVAEGGKRYALIVGVGDYSETVPVKFVDENLDAVERLLTEELFVPAAHIVRIKNPDNLGLEATFGFEAGEPGDFGGLAITQPDAELIVYYVGHGSRDLRAAGTSDAAEAEGYLFASNSRPAHLSRSAYSYDTLLTNLDAFRARAFPEGRVLLFLESCFSGETNDGEALNPSMAAALLAPTVGWDDPPGDNDVIAIAAAGADTPAYWDEERRIGLFTDALVRGLGGAADSQGGDRDGDISVAELGSYLRESVAARARTLGKGEQRPQVQDEDLDKRLVSAVRTGRAEGSPLIEFEVKDLEARLTEADPRDLPALIGLADDVEAFRDTCGDTCRAYLVRLLLLQDDLSQMINRCEISATMASRWQERGSFNRLGVLEQICAPPQMVEACMSAANMDATACRCLRNPRDESCRVDPAQICTDALTAAREEAVAALSLDPILAFQRQQRDCARDTEAVAAAREAVCEAAERAFDADGPIAPQIAACPFAKTIAADRRAAARCRSAYQTATAQADDHAALARFIADHQDCGEIGEARAQVDRRIETALAEADSARAPDERAGARATLTVLRNAYQGALSPAALAAIDDAISALDETACPVALRQAKAEGAAALAQFARERPNCEAEVAEANRIVAAERCEGAFARLSGGSDATLLIAFTQRHRSCEAQVRRAMSLLETLATQCLHRAGEFERSAPREAVRQYRACGSTYGTTFDWAASQATNRMTHLQTAIVCNDAFQSVQQSDASALIGFINRYKAQCPSHTADAARLYAALPAATPDVSRFDGNYDGQRGYTDPRRKSPNRSCLDRYTFTATVRDGELRFHSDNRAWTGRVAPDGTITITRNGLEPRTKSEMWINATATSGGAEGEMFSGFCGSGYFRLTRR